MPLTAISRIETLVQYSIPYSLGRKSLPLRNVQPQPYLMTDGRDLNLPSVPCLLN